MQGNKYALTVGEILNRFRLANKEEGWGFGEEVFDRLAKTAPEWPDGERIFRSLRIRFGEGQDGVQKTFDTHLARAVRLCKNLDRTSSVERVHLRYGSHASVVEWVTIDMGAHRVPQPVSQRSGPRSIADEGLVFAWLYPEYIEMISFWGICPGYFFGGYECEHDLYRHAIPCLDHSRVMSGVFLCGSSPNNAYEGCSVPILLGV